MLRLPAFPGVLVAVAGAALLAVGCRQQPQPLGLGAPEAEASQRPHARLAADSLGLGPEAGAVGTALPDTTPPDTVQTPALPDGFVRLSEVAPSIAQEIRYTTAFNFVGAPIDGYLAPECILTEPAARALARVARALRADGLGLKVYDCYRPQAAVTHFVRWANTPSALEYRDAFYPDEPKGRLFSRGYIATRSGHSRGSTVDLTLVAMPVQASVLTEYPHPDDGPLPRCTGARGERLDERDLDMGTAYDCLSEYAATDHAGMPAPVRRNRDRLRTAMSAGGFRNYSKEWWHFTLRDEPHSRTFFDFPVE